MAGLKALIVIDIQNDFCDAGALAVPGGSEIVARVNTYMANFDTVVLSQDWHPADHTSFASSHPSKSPYDTIEMHYGTQVLWPDHCVIGTQGAEFHNDLDVTRANLIVRKGFRRSIDSYSAFFENDRKTPTGLHGYLQERGITDVTFVGLAFDFCVQYSACDAARLGYSAAVQSDMCRAIDLNGSKKLATESMISTGVSIY